jgi:hypothetical protein
MFYLPLSLPLAEVLRHAGAQLVESTALQSGKSPIRFPMSLEFFVDLILPAALWSWDRLTASNRNDYDKYFLGGKGGR